MLGTRWTSTGSRSVRGLRPLSVRVSDRRADILSLQQPSGVFAGDKYGEVDTRFLYSALNALALLGRLHEVDVEKTVGYIQRCKNFDGGFGAVAGAESHAAMGASCCTLCPAQYANYIMTVFVCVAALAILDRLDVIDQDTLAWWLAERQLPNGGLNGRPEKLEDVCSRFGRYMRHRELMSMYCWSATAGGSSPRCRS